MRRWPALLLVIVVLLLAYVAWPIYGLKKIADAVEARDGAAFTELLDIPELKRSVAVQLVRTYLKVTGKDQRLSPLALNLAIQAGMAVADAYVVEILKAEALIDLLKDARTETFAGPHLSGPGFGTPNLRNLSKLLASEYRGRNFYVSVPLSEAESNSYRLRLRLAKWQWRLAGMELPERVQLRLVEEFRARGGIR